MQQARVSAHPAEGFAGCFATAFLAAVVFWSVVIFVALHFILKVW